MLAIDGRVHEDCAYVRSNTTDSLASFANAGVDPAGAPYGSIASARRVSTTMRMILGFPAAAVDAGWRTICRGCGRVTNPTAHASPMNTTIAPSVPTVPASPYHLRNSHAHPTAAATAPINKSACET